VRVNFEAMIGQLKKLPPCQACREPRIGLGYGISHIKEWERRNLNQSRTRHRVASPLARPAAPRMQEVRQAGGVSLGHGEQRESTFGAAMLPNWLPIGVGCLCVHWPAPHLGNQMAKEAKLIPHAGYHDSVYRHPASWRSMGMATVALGRHRSSTSHPSQDAAGHDGCGLQGGRGTVRVFPKWGIGSCAGSRWCSAWGARERGAAAARP
jgi:hypothetical protein